MNIHPTKIQKNGKRSGSAVIIVLALVSIMVILVSANYAVLGHLRGEMKLIEKKQQQRLQSSQPPAAQPRSR